MRAFAKAATAGPTEAGGKSRGLFRRAFATRGASSGSGGSGAPSRRTPLLILGALVLAITIFFGGALASAATPTVTIEAASEVAFTAAKVKGEVNPEGKETSYHFEYTAQAQFEAEGFANAAQAGAGILSAGEPATPVAATLEGLAPGTTYHLRLVAENEDSAGVPAEAVAATFSTQVVTAPVATAEDASAVTGTTAHFAGTVTAGGTDAAFNSSCTFDYVTAKQFAIDEFTSAQAIGCVPPEPITGTSPTNVSADPTGLQPHTAYHLRLRAANLGGGEVTVAADTFETEAVAPQVLGSYANELSAGAARLNAQINPGGAATTAHFEYLTLSQYLSNGETFAGATSTPESASIGADNTTHEVSASIGGLQASTAYRFRAVVSNSKGVSITGATGFITVTPGGSPSGNCANEQLRAENNSLALPACRAYELVSPDLNHAALNEGGASSPDGDTLAYQSIDAPLNAQSATVFNAIHATRDPISGWSGVSLSPILPGPDPVYASFSTQGVARDLISTFLYSDQELVPGAPSGQNAYIRKADGTYRLLTTVGSPLVLPPILPIYAGNPTFGGGTPDLSTVFLTPAQAQYPTDPQVPFNLYSWSESEGLKLVGMIPDGTPGGTMPAPNGAGLVGFSADARYVAFAAENEIYVRIGNAETEEVSATQRTVEPDPNPVAGTKGVTITSDASTVLFTSKSELTNDANTGESGGVANDAGRDLYSYDRTTGVLTDLTVDNDPADAATGANVEAVQAFSADGSAIYFTAAGNLAPGATPGTRSLYVSHDGQIEFVSKAEGIETNGETFKIASYMTPDGQHLLFASADSLTGYDNRDPITGKPHQEVFESTLGGGLRCISCRPDGTRPTGDSYLPVTAAITPALRLISENGADIFFHSTDALVPGYPAGVQRVFENRSGKISAISPPGPTRSVFLDMSAEGNDVFFSSYDAPVPTPNAGDQMVLDARIGGGFPVVPIADCSGSECQGPQSAAPSAAPPGSSRLAGPGNPKAAKQCKKGQIRKGGKCVKKTTKKKSGKKKSGTKKGAKHTHKRVSHSGIGGVR